MNHYKNFNKIKINNFLNIYLKNDEINKDTIFIYYEYISDYHPIIRGISLKANHFEIILKYSLDDININVVNKKYNNLLKYFLNNGYNFLEKIEQQQSNTFYLIKDDNNTLNFIELVCDKSDQLLFINNLSFTKEVCKKIFDFICFETKEEKEINKKYKLLSKKDVYLYNFQMLDINSEKIKYKLYKSKFANNLKILNQYNEYLKINNLKDNLDNLKKFEIELNENLKKCLLDKNFNKKIIKELIKK